MKSHHALAAALVAAGILSAAPVHAQRAIPDPITVARTALPLVQQKPVTREKVAMGGLLGGIVGLGAGIGAAAILNGGHASEIGDLGALMMGAVIGESVGVALGVHLANDRRGPFVPNALLSMGTAVAGLYVASANP